MERQKQKGFLKKLVCIGLLAACLLNLFPAFAGEGTVYFVSGGKEIHAKLPFSDAYFAGSGREFRQDLALSSIGMATSAFRKPKAEPKERSAPIENYLKQLGFENIRLEQYDVEPDITTIATAIASKTIEGRPGETYTLLAVAISGGGYKDEWKSNFSIGAQEHHEGFDHAARMVLERIRVYMQQMQTGGRPVKLWISGYSRAAATANRTASLVLDSGLLSADHLYAYTFATPNVTTQANAESYPSIYNVVGAFDPVPMVPFATWGFKRFGQTLYLPSPETNSDYDRRVQSVNRIHRELSGSDYWKSTGSDQVVSKLLSALSESVKGSGDYTKKLQPMLLQLWNNKQSPFKMMRVAISGLIKGKNPLKGFFGQTWTIAANALGAGVMQQSGALPNEWNDEKSLKDNLVHEHMPLGYLAWMMAYSRKEDLYSQNQGYAQLAFKGFASLKIKDGSGTLVLDYPAAVYGEQKKPSLTLIQVGDDPAVILPGDQAYSVEMVPSQGEDARLMLRGGMAGSTQVSRFKTEEKSLSAKTLYRLTLPHQAEIKNPHLLTGKGEQLPLQVDTDLATLSETEKNSSFKGYVSKNLVIVVTVMVGFLLQLVFYLSILVRAVRRRKVLLRLKKSGEAGDQRQLRLTASRNKQPLLYGVGAVQLLVSMGIFVHAAYAAYQWLSQVQGVQQLLMFWYFTLYSLPIVVMMLFASVPGFFSALFFFGRTHNEHRLRTVRLYCLFSLVFTGLMLRILLTDLYSFQYSLLRLMGFMQTALLLSVFIVVCRALRKEKHAPEQSI